MILINRTFVYPLKSLPPNVAEHINKILCNVDKKTGMTMKDFWLSQYKGWTLERLEILLTYLDKLAKSD